VIHPFQKKHINQPSAQNSLRPGLTLALILALTACASAATPTPPPEPAPLEASVDFASPGDSPGKQATGLHYGLNLYKIFEPAAAQNPNYRAALAAMRPGIVRIHRGQQMLDSSQDAAGWVIDADLASYRWDRAKIAAALAGLKSLTGPTTLRMMNIANFPGYLKQPGSNMRLKASAFNEYAQFCADLVKIVNDELKLDVRYWEITNELDDGATDATDKYNHDFGEVGDIFNAVAKAIKAIDPSLKVGGPALAQPNSDGQRDEKAFFEKTKASLDFISYHSYFTGNKNQPLQNLYDNASAIGSITSVTEGLWRNYSNRPIESFHDEYNISWNPPDVRMTNEIGAVFDALALAALAKSGATGGMAWNEADGWYGKLGASFEQRPASWVFGLYNQFLLGEIVADRSSDRKKLEVFAVKSSNSDPQRYSLALINRSGAAQTLKLTLSGLGIGNSTKFSAHQVTATGLQHRETTLAALTGSDWLLPQDSVTVLTSPP
jgi:hypothetical protein